MTKIKASFVPCRGIAPCSRCPKDPDHIDRMITYGGQASPEEAEKLAYADLFREQMNLQNKRYKERGNYDRIWTMDEWRTSVRHRPIENVLQIGNTHYYLPQEFLWDAYEDFYEWRYDNFGSNFVLIYAAVYSGWKVPHIHERCVLYYTDQNGVRHTGIDKALEQAEIGLPFKGGKNQQNHRKKLFDHICRQKWSAIISDKLKVYPNLELERPDSELKFTIKFDRRLRLELKQRQALRNTMERNRRKIEELAKKIADLEKNLEAVHSEMDAGDITDERKAVLKEQMLIFKNKIKEYTKRMEKAKLKGIAIQDTLAGQ